MDETLKSLLLDSIWANRAVVFSGAGLSMALPSTVPSAAVLADQCSLVYEQMSGTDFPPEYHWNIEKLANYFAERNQLESVFLGPVIRGTDISSFMRSPNLGHEAIGDFLGCHAIQLGISTNVDGLTEQAAEDLGEPISEVSVTCSEAQTGSQEHSPHIKLHGCFRRNIKETLWCSEQLTRSPFKERISDFQQCLPSLLLGRDLIFVGFWSDWGYLNAVLESVLTHSQPKLIVLVNPSDPENVKSKAPGLWELAHKPSTTFWHVRESGAAFLDELRRGFGIRFMKQILKASLPSFKAQHGRDPSGFPNFEAVSATSLYQWRRDATCTPPDKIVRQKQPDQSMQQLGVAHLSLSEEGAAIEGDAYSYLGRRVRLVHGAGRYLSEVQRMFTSSSSVLSGEDIVVCVGAHDTSPLPADIVRNPENTNVVNRGDPGVWLTETNAEQYFASLKTVAADSTEPECDQ